MYIYIVNYVVDSLFFSFFFLLFAYNYRITKRTPKEYQLKCTWFKEKYVLKKNIYMKFSLLSSCNTTVELFFILYLCVFHWIEVSDWVIVVEWFESIFIIFKIYTYLPIDLADCCNEFLSDHHYFRRIARVSNEIKASETKLDKINYISHMKGRAVIIWERLYVFVVVYDNVIDYQYIKRNP